MIKILDGKKIAEEMRVELRLEISEMKKEGVVPGLAVILAGKSAASQIYVRNKERACESLGIFSEVHRLDEDVKEAEILALIAKLNADEKIHGILVQLPLPAHLDPQKIISAISPKKDVDCFHPENVGRMFLGEPIFLPCTPAGIMEMLKRYEIEISGKNVVIVGRSNIVGKPLAVMMLKENATVTIAHSKTKNLAVVAKQADILVAAVGRAGLITADMIKQGAVVVDVGINRGEDGKLAGDVDFEKVSEVAGAITPVPGGVGPMTIAMLMKNTVAAAKMFYEIRKYGN
ncbi:MAG: bifunctional methylenetetrahydrofolate dehydrogenase/methenyltetrahydrofolate cyclohydrolase FolD [Parcubacteria group bacterium]